MCTAGIDCKFCDTIETCKRVAAAFPTQAEAAAGTSKNIRARQRNAAARGADKTGLCNVADCYNRRHPHSSLCTEHTQAYRQAWYQDHPNYRSNQNAQVTARLRHLKATDPAAYRAYLDRKNATRKARRKAASHA